MVYFYPEFDYNWKQTGPSHVVWGQTHGFPGVRFRQYGAAPPSDPYPRGLVGGVILTAGSEPGNTPLGNRTRPHVRPDGRQRQQTLPGSASASRDPRLRLRNPRHLLSTGFPLLNDVQARIIPLRAISRRPFMESMAHPSLPALKNFQFLHHMHADAACIPRNPHSLPDEENT